MDPDGKYTRLLEPSDTWYRFGCIHIETWVDNAANTEEVYNNLRKHRKDLPEWPVTVFGPVEYIKKITKWDVLFAELVDSVEKELTETMVQPSSTMDTIVKTLREGDYLFETTRMPPKKFREFMRIMDNDLSGANTVCFSWSMSKIRGASPPGTRKFLQQIQDMILTYCDPPNSRRRPLLAVQTTHPKLDEATVLSALNFAHLHRLKHMGNVRACKNWVGEKRDELREYRKHLFRGYRAAGTYQWLPFQALINGYNLDQCFESIIKPHAVIDDPDDGQQTPPRSASPGPGDPFWEDVFHAEAPPESDRGSDQDERSNADKPSAPGKNSARNKRKAEKKRLRKSAKQIVDSVFHHSGAGTPVGPIEQEATRATTPAPSPRVLTEEEKKEARTAKARARRQRQKERQAVASKPDEENEEAAAEQEDDEDRAVGPQQKDDDDDDEKEATPLASAAPSPSRSPAPSPAVVAPSPPSPTPGVVPAVPAAPAATAVASPSPVVLTPTSSAAPPSPPPGPGPVSPLCNTPLLSTSGAPLPVFWALDVDDLQEDIFLSPSSSSSSSS
ncbi:hypothetical protein NKR19_g10260, partial [Coniochaeta hoffmannii]